MKILGIDPGSTRMGYGCLEKTGAKLEVIAYGVLETKERELGEKLGALKKNLEALLDRLTPEAAGVEKLYFSKNRKTALEVAHARGVIMTTLQGRGIRVFEYAPQEIKSAVTNYGRADKRAVEKMVKKILNLEDFEGYDDASDALAVAITAAHSEQY